jgi:hypothetical protein
VDPGRNYPGLRHWSGFLLRKSSDAPPELSPQTSPSVAATGSSFARSENSLLAALKDELFAIETDRVQGKLSDSDYVELKSALELVLRRALSRQAA